MLASACLSAAFSSSPSIAATHGFLVPSGNRGDRRPPRHMSGTHICPITARMLGAHLAEYALLDQ